MTYVGEASLGHSLVVFDADGVARLAGSRCPECGDVRIPAREHCPNDLSACEDTMLSGSGVIYEAVRISLAPGGFEGPFWAGYIDLDEGARLFAQVAWSEGQPDPSHGDAVTMSIEAIGDGTRRVDAPVFVPVVEHVAH